MTDNDLHAGPTLRQRLRMAYRWQIINRLTNWGLIEERPKEY